MTPATIQKIIRRANNPIGDELIQTLPISITVSFAKVWTGKQWNNPAAFGLEPFHFYLIKNKESEYVAAILDMTSDLQWYVTPKHRKKGHLTKALNEVILPYILKNREELYPIYYRYTQKSYFLLNFTVWDLIYKVDLNHHLFDRTFPPYSRTVVHILKG